MSESGDEALEAYRKMEVTLKQLGHHIVDLNDEYLFTLFGQFLKAFHEFAHKEMELVEELLREPPGGGKA